MVWGWLNNQIGLDDSVAKILRHLRKLELLVCEDCRLSYEMISAVSESIISLTCNSGLKINNLDESSSLSFERLEEIVATVRDKAEAVFLLEVLENSTLNSRPVSLKKLSLIRNVPHLDVGDTSIESSLIKVIAVCHVFLQVYTGVAWIEGIGAQPSHRLEYVP